MATSPRSLFMHFHSLVSQARCDLHLNADPLSSKRDAIRTESLRQRRGKRTAGYKRQRRQRSSRTQRSSHKVEEIPFRVTAFCDSWRVKAKAKRRTELSESLNRDNNVVKANILHWLFCCSENEVFENRCSVNEIEGRIAVDSDAFSLGISFILRYIKSF